MQKAFSTAFIALSTLAAAQASSGYSMGGGFKLQVQWDDENQVVIFTSEQPDNSWLGLDTFTPTF